MPWMDVHIEIKGSDPIKNVVNINQIVRFGPRVGGSYIRTADGLAIDVLDPFEDILKVVLAAESK